MTKSKGKQLSTPYVNSSDSKPTKAVTNSQVNKPSHKRKLATQIHYEKKSVEKAPTAVPAGTKSTGAELTVILKESLEAFNKFLTMQNSLSFFNYFPFYPEHVKSSLLRQALKSTEDLQNFLEKGKFDAPHSNTTIYEKKINYGNAQLLRHNQEGMIDDLFKIRKDLKASMHQSLNMEQASSPKPSTLERAPSVRAIEKGIFNKFSNKKNQYLFCFFPPTNSPKDLIYIIYFFKEPPKQTMKPTTTPVLEVTHAEPVRETPQRNILEMIDFKQNFNNIPQKYFLTG
jgi:hypothetical protein